MGFLAKLRAVKRYLSDPSVPWRRKIWVYVILIYFLSPLDFLPDILPGLGWLDDLIVLSAGLLWLSRELGRYQGGTAADRSDATRTIDVEYTVAEEEDSDHQKP